LASGGNVKVTAYMAGRWVKAAFLVILGILILLYANRLVEDFRNTMDGNFDVAFEWTWDLLTILLWVLVAWLFVDAALTVAVSVEQSKYTIQDVVRRLDRIEKKLGIRRPKVELEDEEEEETQEEVKELKEEEVEVVFDKPRPAVEEDVPPPPAPPPPGE